MVWVNLLPWRHRQLKAKWHRACLALVVMLAACMFAILPASGLRAVNEQTTNLVRRTEESIRQLDALKTRSIALAQQQKQLQQKLADAAHRRERLRQWHDFTLRLPDLMPETLWLTELAKTADNLAFTGFCAGMADINIFRLRLQALPLFRQVRIGKLSRDPQGTFQFSLQATLASQEKNHE